MKKILIFILILAVMILPVSCTKNKNAKMLDNTDLASKSEANIEDGKNQENQKNQEKNETQNNISEDKSSNKNSDVKKQPNEVSLKGNIDSKTKENSKNIDIVDKKESSEAKKDEKDEKSEKDEKKEQTVTVSITGDKDTGVILDTFTSELKDGDTVFDILNKVVKSEKIHMEYKGKKSKAYVSGIDNIYELDKGAGSGWMYSVNGVFPNESCGSYELKAGDEIKWLYTLDLGKDIGANLKTDNETKDGE